MKTVTVDILQDKAIDLLRDLGALNVIKLHDDQKKADETRPNLSAKYRGAMSKQLRKEVDKQLDDLRNE